MILRSVLTAAISLVMIASAPAQQLKDRELKPAVNSATIETPVDIVSIKLNGSEVAQGEKIKGDDNWLKGVSFTVKNVSDKPIAYVAIGLRFEGPPGGHVIVHILSYGVDYSRGQPRNGSSPSPIQPGQAVDLVLADERYPAFLQVLDQAGISPDFSVVPYSVDRVCFEDDPNIIWSGGYLKRKNPAAPGRFEIIEKYRRPTKP